MKRKKDKCDNDFVEEDHPELCDCDYFDGEEDKNE